MQKNVDKSHIIFDCDGTLISSFYAILNDVQSLVEKLTGKKWNLQDLKREYTPDLATYALKLGLDLSTEQKKAQMLNLWSAQMAANSNSRFALFPGIKELILNLKNSGHQLYVWTARDRYSTTEILKELQVLQYFEDLRCVDDCRPKPDTQGLAELVGDYDKANIVVIGDSSTDIQGGHDFGIKTIAAQWCDHANFSSLVDIVPDFKAQTPQQCNEILNEIF